MKAILARYLGPTDTRGSRIVATAEGGHRLTIGIDNRYDVDKNADQAAEKLARDAGWLDGGAYRLVGGGLPDGDRCYVLVPDTADCGHTCPLGCGYVGSPDDVTEHACRPADCEIDR